MAPYRRCHRYCSFWRFYLFPPHGWVQLLIGIADCIRRTFLSDHIVNICHYFVRDIYRLNCVVSHSLEILFQKNCATSPSLFFSLFPPHGWVQPLVVIEDSIRSSLLSYHITPFGQNQWYLVTLYCFIICNKYVMSYTLCRDLSQ